MSYFVDRVARGVALQEGDRTTEEPISRRDAIRRASKIGLALAAAAGLTKFKASDVSASYRYCNLCVPWEGNQSFWVYARCYCFFSDIDGHFVNYLNNSCTMIDPYCHG